MCLCVQTVASAYGDHLMGNARYKDAGISK